jgi:hypothetical protein
MDLGAYFVTFIALLLIFMYAYYGREEEQTNE